MRSDVTTPTIVLHGEEDTTDTIGQSMIFYQALKDRGGTVTLGLASVLRAIVQGVWGTDLRAYPELFEAELVHQALHFVLGSHPGADPASFVSGVGARSVTSAYGFQRAAGAHIPGGVVSGSALVRPDLVELHEWPYLWQQTEYVLGHGTADFLFLALAADRLLSGR